MPIKPSRKLTRTKRGEWKLKTWTEDTNGQLVYKVAIDEGFADYDDCVRRAKVRKAHSFTLHGNKIKYVAIDPQENEHPIIFDKATNI